MHACTVYKEREEHFLCRFSFDSDSYRQITRHIIININHQTNTNTQKHLR